MSGSGGSVALLSTSGTSFAGKVSARGGRRDGDGGDIEISSKTGLQITGSVDASALTAVSARSRSTPIR